MELERQLRDALRPVDPGARFTAAVEARMAAAPVAVPLQSRRWALPASLAASVAATLLVAAFTGLYIEQRHQQQRVAQAQAQLIQALDITSRRLEAVHHRLETQFAEDSP